MKVCRFGGSCAGDDWRREVRFKSGRLDMYVKRYKIKDFPSYLALKMRLD